MINEGFVHFIFGKWR